MQIVKKKVNAEEALLTILNVVKNTQDKMIHELMCDQTGEENFELCIAFYWLRINKDEIPKMPIDGGYTEEEGQQIVAEMLSRFEDAKMRIAQIFKVSSMVSAFIPKEHMNEDLKKLHPNLDIDKLCEIHSYLQMNVRDERDMRN